MNPLYISPPKITWRYSLIDLPKGDIKFSNYINYLHQTRILGGYEMKELFFPTLLLLNFLIFSHLIFILKNHPISILCIHLDFKF